MHLIWAATHFETKGAHLSIVTMVVYHPHRYSSVDVSPVCVTFISMKVIGQSEDQGYDVTQAWSAPLPHIPGCEQRSTCLCCGG